MKTKAGLLTAVCAVLAAQCAQSAPIPAGGAEAGVRLRVATCNVRVPVDYSPNSWEERRDALADLLAKMDIDAGGLQEAIPQQVEFLRTKMPGYAFYGDYRNADRVTGEASSVFYRTNRFELVRGGTFWLSETPEVPGRKGWNAACPRVCTWAVLREKATGACFCFANTHTDHKSAEARKNGMELILKRMDTFAKGLPVVFTGDHNCGESSAPAQMAAKKLDNALYTTLTPPKGPWRTFNGWRWIENEMSAAEAMKHPMAVREALAFPPAADGTPASPTGPRGDYIYVSRDVKVLEFETYGDTRSGTRLYPTDHYPLGATILLPLR